MVFRITGESDAKQYLEASNHYLADSSCYRRMRFPFPNVRERCLLCGSARCSRWKGYYVRQVVCTRLRYAGPVVIHLAQCGTRGVDYTYWPDMLVPFLQPSIQTLRVFYETWVSHDFDLLQAIDEVVGQVDSEYFLPISVAHCWLRRTFQGLILQHQRLQVRAPQSLGAHALRAYAPADVAHLFEAERLWRAGAPTVFSPP